jgi:3-phenylpropionate/cinnamic acid dioxygenase small subunit
VWPTEQTRAAAFYVGARQHKLRRIDCACKIANRRIVLHQNVLTTKNLSIFF